MGLGQILMPIRVGRQTDQMDCGLRLDLFGLEFEDALEHRVLEVHKRLILWIQRRIGLKCLESLAQRVRGFGRGRRSAHEEVVPREPSLQLIAYCQKPRHFGNRTFASASRAPREVRCHLSS